MKSEMTIPQRFINHLGQKELAPAAEADAGNLTVEDYRKAGVRRFARHAGHVIVAAAATYVLVQGGEYALDHAETLNRDFDQEHARNFGETPQDSRPESVGMPGAGMDAVRLPEVDLANTVAVQLPTTEQ